MAELQSELINMSTAYDDIEKINFKSMLLTDPVRAQQYKNDRIASQTGETLDIKRGNFQKAVNDMGRYMDMDHHARYYDTRNTDLNAAQNNIIQIANSNTTALTFDMDNT